MGGSILAKKAHVMSSLQKIIHALNLILVFIFLLLTLSFLVGTAWSLVTGNQEYAITYFIGFLVAAAVGSWFGKSADAWMDKYGRRKVYVVFDILDKDCSLVYQGSGFYYVTTSIIQKQDGRERLQHEILFERPIYDLLKKRQERTSEFFNDRYQVRFLSWQPLEETAY